MMKVGASLRRQSCNTSPPNFSNKAFSCLISPNHTLESLLKACRTVSQVSQIHASMLKIGLHHHSFFRSKLLAASILDIHYAASIFHSTTNPNLYMFNTILRGFSASDNPFPAFTIFNNLRTTGVFLDQFSFITTLKSCARLRDFRFGVEIHGVALRSGHLCFTDVRNVLLRFYCVCGSIQYAHKVFDEIPQRNDVVSWNTLMGGYLNASQPDMVFDLFRRLCSSGLEHTETTLLCVSTSAGDLQDLVGAKSIHGHCIKLGLSSRLNLTTALIDTYAKVGDLQAGRDLFDEMPQRDVAMWNCLIHWYAKKNMLEESLSLLKLMELEHISPSSSTLAGLLSVCAASGSLDIGRSIHEYAKTEGLEIDTIMGTALIDMYAKCGVLQKAIDVFDEMRHKDVKCWTAMISAYGNHGQAQNASTLFTQMEKEGFEPNEVAFLAILSGCSHGGLVEEAKCFFHKMVRDYNILPKVEHYGCLVDLCGRLGLLDEAYELIKGLPLEADGTAWRALLAGCRMYGDVELGERVKKVLVETCEEHPTDAILVSSTYAAAGMIKDGSNMRERSTLTKAAGCSSIEVHW